MGKTLKGKDKAKAKIAEAKKKIVRKAKGTAAIALLLGAASILALSGCSTADPSSRSTSATYGDIIVKIDDHSRGTIKLTIGDGAIASADSSGSTESMTASPTNKVTTDLDAAYNGPAKQAASALDSLLGTGANALIKWLTAPGTNTVTVTGADGQQNTLQCADGSCYVK